MEEKTKEERKKGREGRKEDKKENVRACIYEDMTPSSCDDM